MMKNHKTPKPESPEYNVEKPQNLNKPAFNSSTDRRESKELPAVEHMDDQRGQQKETKSNSTRPPKTNLGSGERRKDEDEREKIIRR